jgi:hypothetical protein
MSECYVTSDEQRFSVVSCAAGVRCLEVYFINRKWIHRGNLYNKNHRTKNRASMHNKSNNNNNNDNDELLKCHAEL